MSQENYVVLEGQVASAPYRKAVRGTSLCSFLLQHRTLRNGKHVEETFSIELWGPLAEGFVGVEGDPVLITGSLRQRTWEKSGTSHSRVWVRGQKVRRLLKRQPKTPAAT